MPCPDCGSPTAPGARFCDQCGRRVGALTDGLTAGDRRVVSALFADLVGYTRLVDELDLLFRQRFFLRQVRPFRV